MVNSGASNPSHWCPPGYWRRPDLTREQLDEDGFLKTGDAGKLANPDDPSKGILFDGRLAENFKLTSGTWVHHP